MDKKALVKRYIDTMDAINKTSRQMNECFETVDPDNQIFRIVPGFVTQFLSDLVFDQLSDQEIGWIDWWLYDCCEFGSSERKGFVSDETGAGDLKTFDEFYAFAFEEKPMNEMLGGLH